MSSTALHVRLGARELSLLRKEASARGLPVSSLARSLIVESLLHGVAQERAIEFLDVLEGDPKLRYRLSRILLLLPQEPD